MKTIYFLFIVIINTNFVLTQSINIIVNDLDTSTANFFYLEGDKTFYLDSINSNEDKTFVILTNNYKLHAGFYRLAFNKNKWIDFIYDNEQVEIKTDANYIPAMPAGRLDNLEVITSESNKLFYSFVKINKAFKTKSELLQLILARYPNDDDYYKITQSKLYQLQNEYLHFVNNTSQLKPASFISRYVRSAQLPIVDYNLSLEEQLIYLKTHSLDNVDFTDTELIYSDIYTNKAIEYLTYYRNPQLPKELLEKEFMIAVDTLLNKAKVNELVYQHVVEYLIDGFKKFGFDETIDYILNNYVMKDDLCLDQELESSLERRIEHEKNFRIGNLVPNIIIPDSSGNEIELNKINSDRILILFYASWCPHCKDLLPQISQLYNDQKKNDTEVLAVSIDTSKTEWLNFVKSNKFNWINVSNLNGWSGKAAMEYYLYATPTMILVDSDKKIIAKPSSLEDLKQWF